MKQAKDVVACVVDYGTFICVAEKLSETYKKVYYHSPYETEYQDVRDCLIGTGIDGVERCDNLFNKIDEIDLFVFPDIGFASLQRYLRSIGKAVWGHMGATELELDRVKFMSTVRALDLEVPDWVVVNGVDSLEGYLAHHKDKWVKTSRYRGNLETWHHLDIEHSKRTLDNMRVIFGGAADQVQFVVMDNIKTDVETGYDGWCIDGMYPSSSFQGYEKKNELYLGSVMASRDLPDEIKDVNLAFASVLADYGYRCWWATEIRVSDGTPYFIDPTPRMPGQTGEHQTESIANFAQIVWMGANGFRIDPEYNYKFAAEATLHYDSNTKDPTVSDEWKTLVIPPDVVDRVKLYRYFEYDNQYHFSAKGTDEVGVVIGLGTSTRNAILDLQKNYKRLSKLPLHANLGGFRELLDSIKVAEKQGIAFGGSVPSANELDLDES